MLLDRQTSSKAIRELIDERRFTELKSELGNAQVADIADLITDIPPRDRAMVFRLLPKDVAIDVFEELPPEGQELLLNAFSDEYVADLVDEMSPDDRTELFEEMPAAVTSRLIRLISPAEREITARLLGYGERTAGRLMTTEYVSLQEGMTAEQALRRIREEGPNKETVYYSYVTDRGRKLKGVVALKSLVLAEPDTLVSALMDADVIAANTDDDQESAADLMTRYDFLALPVVDSEGRLVGIVTADDAIDIVEEEATEDFHKGAAIAPVRSYREAGVGSLFRKRITWLIILVFVNLLSSTVIAAYQEVLTTTIALAFFIPLLIGSGGNAGAQSATLMVRAIAVGDVHLMHWFRTVMKEVGVGVCLGIAMGLGSAVLGVWRGGPVIGLIVGLSMVFIVLAANLVGALLPFILTRVRLDPAVASSPLITTIVDATGLVIYFSIATWILHL